MVLGFNAKKRWDTGCEGRKNVKRNLINVLKAASVAIVVMLGVRHNLAQPYQAEEKAGAVRAKPVVILMEYPDLEFKDVDQQAGRYRKLSGKDFTAAHVDEWLFKDGFYTTCKDEGGRKVMSVREFYKQMTDGRYHFEGEVFGPYMAKHEAAWYGTDRAASDPENVRTGTNQDEGAELVKEAVEALLKNPQRDGKKVRFRPEDFDLETRSPFVTDLSHPDGYRKPSDKAFGKPDGIVDTVIVVHAGVGHEWGGGNLGEKAIHPYRMGFSWFWNWDKKSEDYVTCKVKGRRNKAYEIEDFVLIAQDAALDILDHEHGHVLGLPDLYDTTGSGSEPPVCYWDIMGGGYTGGDVIGSAPASYGAYSREWLQENFKKRKVKQPAWLANKKTLSLKDIGKEGADLYLNQAHDRKTNLKEGYTDMVRINMPDMPHGRYPGMSHEGKSAFYTGNSDNARTSMKVHVSLKGVHDARLQFATCYDIDPGFDFFTVRVNEKGQTKWETLKGSCTTDKLDDWLLKEENCSAKERQERLPGHGITGRSDGWTDASFDLSKYDGKDIDISFCFYSDDNTPGMGLFMDDILVTGSTEKGERKDILKITADHPEGVDLTEGFALGDVVYKTPFRNIRPDSDETRDEHYYLLEWRNMEKGRVDEGLEQVRAYWPEITYNPGLLVWHIDKKWETNQGTPDQGTKTHPGECMVGIVDADQMPVGYWWDVNKNPDDPDWVYKRDTRSDFDMHDAAFSLSREKPFSHKWNAYSITEELPGEDLMVPIFSDDRNYENNSVGRGWEGDDFETGRQWGLRLPHQGLRIFVTKEKADHSGGEIHIMNRNKGGEKVDYSQGLHIESLSKDGNTVTLKALNGNREGGFGKEAYIGFKDGETLVLKGEEGVYAGELAENSQNVEFVILTDQAGNKEALYNAEVCEGYGTDIRIDE